MTAILTSIALKGLLVLLLAALAARLLRKAPASARHGVWAAAFGGLLLLPVLEVAGPEWAVGVLPAESTAAVAPVAPVAPIPPAPPIPAVAPAPPAPPSPAGIASYETDVAAFEQEMATFEAEMADFERMMETEVAAQMAAFEAEMEAYGAEMDAHAAELAAAAEAGATGWTVAAAPAPGRSLPPLGRWALGLWALGVAAVGLSWAGATLAARRLVARATPETDAEWGVLAERARRLSGIEGPVRLLRSDALDVPIAWGWGTPAVVLPPSADDWDEGRREAVLLHEMAHLRRRDAWTQLVAQAALAVHWLNPIAWWAYRRFLDAREQACDDAVLQGGARPSDYAAHLVGVARALRREPFGLAAVSPMARKACPLEDRIVSILDADRRRGHVGRVARLATVVLAGAVILPLAALQPVAQTAKQATAPVVERAAPAAVKAVAPVVAISPAPSDVLVIRADTTDEDHAHCDHPVRLREAHADLAAARAELHRALGDIDVESLHADIRRAMATVEIDLSGLDTEQLQLDLRRALREAEISITEIDTEALRRDLRRAMAEIERSERHLHLEAGVEAEVHREVRRELERARVEVEAARRELDRDLRQMEREVQREVEQAQREAARDHREALREIENAQREAERDRREALRDAERDRIEALREANEARVEAERERLEALREAEADRREALREAEADRREALREAEADRRKARRQVGWVPQPTTPRAAAARAWRVGAAPAIDWDDVDRARAAAVARAKDAC